MVDPITICYTKREEQFLKKFLRNTFVISLGGLNPNRALWKFYDKIKPKREKKSVNLLYVGKIDRAKLPLWIVDVLKKCSDKLGKKIVFYLLIAGAVNNGNFFYAGT